jgi:hypothetical protein
MSYLLIESLTESSRVQEPVRAGHAEAVRRREQFAGRHPEIDIRGTREGARLVFHVTAPDLGICWHDPTAMMDDLEARYL